jgi:putative nucleotidyltransferase with HDIG domain
MKGLKDLLLVEENERQRKHLANLFSDITINTHEATSMIEAANRLLSSDDFSLVLINFVSHEDQKIDLIRNIRLSNPELGIILLTAKEKPDIAISLLKQGVIDHLVDPDNPASIISAILNESNKREILRENELYQKQLNLLDSEQGKSSSETLDWEEIYDSTLENLMTALDLRDVETFGHSKTVAKYSQMLAQILGIKEKKTLDNIRKGGLLHDIGKIAIPDSILKKPDPLSDKEWEKIKLHPALGYGLIKEIKMLKEVGNIILYHHERYDGAGYPKGFKKDEIPIEARIFALADALDAITSYRPYREKRDFDAAKKEIQKNSKTQFDPVVVDAFCSLDLDIWEKVRFETTKLIPSFIGMK